MDIFLDNYPPFKELHSILANLVCCLYFFRFFAHKFVILFRGWQYYIIISYRYTVIVNRIVDRIILDLQILYHLSLSD